MGSTRIQILTTEASLHIKPIFHIHILGYVLVPLSIDVLPSEAFVLHFCKFLFFQVQMQLMGMHQQVVPLQCDAVEEPVFVNAKQYHGILRRRQSRAKLEARNRAIKSKKVK